MSNDPYADATKKHEVDPTELSGKTLRLVVDWFYAFDALLDSGSIDDPVAAPAASAAADLAEQALNEETGVPLIEDLRGTSNPSNHTYSLINDWRSFSRSLIELLAFAAADTETLPDMGEHHV